MNELAPHEEDVVDTAHRVLANRQRRQLLRILDEEEGRMAVETLATRVSGLDATADMDVVWVTIHHQHLPLLDDADAVDVDGDRVELTPYGEQVAELGRVTADVVAGRPER